MDYWQKAIIGLKILGLLKMLDLLKILVLLKILGFLKILGRLLKNLGLLGTSMALVMLGTAIVATMAVVKLEDLVGQPII